MPLRIITPFSECHSSQQSKKSKKNTGDLHWTCTPMCAMAITAPRSFSVSRQPTRHWFKIGRPSSKSQKASFPTIWKASWALVTIAGRNGKNGWVGRALAHAITRITSTLPSKTKFLLITGKLMFFLRDKPECEEDRGVSKSQFILFRFLPVAYRNSVEQSNLWLYIYWFYRKRHATLYRCLNIFKSQTELSSGAALAR